MDRDAKTAVNYDARGTAWKSMVNYDRLGLCLYTDDNYIGGLRGRIIRL